MLWEEGLHSESWRCHTVRVWWWRRLQQVSCLLSAVNSTFSLASSQLRTRSLRMQHSSPFVWVMYLITVDLLKASVFGARLKANTCSNLCSFATKFSPAFVGRDNKIAPKCSAVLMAYKVWVFWNYFCTDIQSCTFRKGKLANQGSGCSVTQNFLPNRHGHKDVSDSVSQYVFHITAVINIWYTGCIFHAN